MTNANTKQFITIMHRNVKSIRRIYHPQTGLDVLSCVMIVQRGITPHLNYVDASIHQFEINHQLRSA